MNPWKLRFTMLGTLAVIISVSTAFFTFLLQSLGALNILSLATLVTAFNVLQWLLAPYLIKTLYRVRAVEPGDYPTLRAMMDRLSKRSGVKTPKLGFASIPMPNAFAYGSPLTGNRVAVTQGLLDTLEEEEVEAVLGHELGHLKHRDVQVMMLVSFLPSLIYLIGRSMLYSSYFGGYEGRNRRGGGNGVAILLGTLSMTVYFVLMLFTLSLSRLREYYADSHSASIVEDGPRKLSEGLAKIVSETRRTGVHQDRDAPMFSSFKTLFISDPDNVERDAAAVTEFVKGSSDRELVEHLIKRRVTAVERAMELFSTHPNITKRLKVLKALDPQREGVFHG